MKTNTRHKIVIVGCGNVAWHLAKHLSTLNEYDITVYNRQPNVLLTDFKTKLKCAIQTGLERIRPDAEYYFICVADESIGDVAKKINSNNPNAILVHTSGSAKMKVLGERVHGTGVFYPLQTFSKADSVNWQTVPVIIEGNGKNTEKNLGALAKTFSSKVISLTYKERLRLHLAAVLVNNFTNALYAAAENLLKSEDNKTDLSLLLPLIEKTAEKLKSMPALAAQTGPAKRKDKSTIKKHIELLNDDKDLAKIYKQMTGLIQKQQKPFSSEL